ncbi:hypothetical protein BC937DRAFT_91429 [Endogone sp. FLAS-F59071]|nr:hypothetical protein BC937DRAFT_91429 [Endogone sp. FLAS-F59071]|eukprot:RUS21800.1 hypothetical protein BC937DRAFT_91429 [Endogone sp. FLAS-F59071]
MKPRLGQSISTGLSHMHMPQRYTKKTLRTDALNLIEVLKNHLDCEVKIATKLKVFCTQAIGTRLTLYALNMLPNGRFLAMELASASIPFSFNGRNQMKAILRMMAIFHVRLLDRLDEVMSQEKLLEEINRAIVRETGTMVREILKIPRGIQGE